MPLSNAVLEAALKASIARLVTTLANKDALNSLKLEGKTLAEITTLILQGKAATAGTADNSLKLGGKDLATLEKEYTDAIEAEVAKVTKESIGLGLVENMAVATEEEALAGAADKYVTAALAQQIAAKKIDDLIDGAPNALDTLKEIADALNNDPDIINKILAAIDEKETDAGAQAKADKALADAKTYADVGDKALGDRVDAQADELEELVKTLTATFEAEADKLEGKVTPEVPAGE